MNKTKWKNEKGEIVHFMKIIELLNKNANGEEVPEKIKFHGLYFEFDALERQYRHNDIDLGVAMDGLKYSQLNDEVEIIEEDKTIEEFDFDYNAEKLADIIIQMKQKINELVKEINKLKEN